MYISGLLIEELLKTIPETRFLLMETSADFIESITNKLQNGVYIAQVMIMLKKTLIRHHDGPVSIDPMITKLKDNITDAAKLYNWNVIGKELRKFGIKLTQEKKRKLIESEAYSSVRTILYELF